LTIFNPSLFSNWTFLFFEKFSNGAWAFHSYLGQT
jgi:hypothetical protein